MAESNDYIEDKVAAFEHDFRDWLNGSVRYFNLTGKPLSSEDEIKWLKDYLRPAFEAAFAAGRRDEAAWWFAHEDELGNALDARDKAAAKACIRLAFERVTEFKREDERNDKT